MHHRSHKAHRHQHALLHRSLSATLLSADNMDVYRVRLFVVELIKEADITNLQVIVQDKLSPSMYKPPAASGHNIIKPHFQPVAMPLKNDSLLLFW